MRRIPAFLLLFAAISIGAISAGDDLDDEDGTPVLGAAAFAAPLLEESSGPEYWPGITTTSTSTTTTTTTTTEPPPPPPATEAPPPPPPVEEPVDAPSEPVEEHSPVDLPEHLVRIRQCESGGNYAAISPGGKYRGAYQFLQSTWNNVARSLGRPDLVGVDPAMASPGDQDAMARHLYEIANPYTQWPVCARR